MGSVQTLLPQTVVTLRDGIKSNIKAELLVPGDIIEVFDGDIIPADIRILSVSGFKVWKPNNFFSENSKKLNHFKFKFNPII